MYLFFIKTYAFVTCHLFLIFSSKENLVSAISHEIIKDTVSFCEMIRDDIKSEYDQDRPLLDIEKAAISKMISLSIDSILLEFDYVPKIKKELREVVLKKVRIKARWVMSDFKIFEDYEIE